jgi:hypothetical protein
MSENGATIAGLKLANVFVLTTRGVPQLYYGDEIALEGGDEPSTRGDFPGGFPGDKQDAFTAGGRTKDEQELFEFIRRLTTLRRQFPALTMGSLVNLYVAPQQYVYARTLRHSAAIIVFNNDNKEVEFEFDLPPANIDVGNLLHDVVNGTVLQDRLGVVRDVTVRDGKVRLSLPERSVAIFTLQFTRKSLVNHVKQTRQRNPQ